MSSIRILALMVGLSVIYGCGGSGNGGGGLGGNNNPPAPLAVLTTDNADQMAGIAAGIVVEDNIFGAIGAPGVPFVSTSTDAANVLMSIANLPMPPGVMAAQSSMDDCAVSGTVDVTIDIQNPLTLSEDDEFGFLFSACDDGSGTVVDGGLTMIVTDFQGDLQSGMYLLGMSITLDAFSITQGGETTGASATIAFSIDTRNPPVTTITLSTSAMTTTVAGTTETVNNLSITITEDESAVPTAISTQTSFRLSSPRLGGDILVSTSVSLQSSGDGFPIAGEFRIEAADNAAIVVVAIDGTMVSLQIDLNGDGDPDETRDMTWDQLIAAANSTS